jgi:oligopeptidase B
MQHPKPPLAPKRDTILMHHGIPRTDPWYWLRYRDDPAVMDYLNAENAYTDAVMASTRDLQAMLYKEMRARIKEDDATVPEKEGAYFYYERYEQGDQYPIYCRKHQSLDAPEEILLDVNQLSKDESYIELGVCENSPDHRYLVYSLDLDGSEEYTVAIKDLHNRNLLDERIERTYDSLEWANDGRVFFYTLLDEHKRPLKVFRHRLGDSPARDQLVFEEKDPRFFVSLFKSESKRFIFICSEGNNTSEWHYIDANNPEGGLILIEPRAMDHEYDVTDHGARFLIRTNIGGAKDFKIIEVPIATPSSKHWKDLIAHRPGRLISDLVVFRDYLVVSETHRGLPQIRVMEFASGKSHYLPFAEQDYDVRVMMGREFDTTILRYSYSSLTTPQEIYDYDMKTATRTLRKRKQVLGGFRSDDYETKRIYANSRDGVEIPISLLLRKGTPRDGSAPLVLYGYGSYGHSIAPRFNQMYLSYVDRGFIYAIAHVRGGMEMGYQWYEDGKLLNKKNTFDDYLTCAEHLIQEKFTTKGRILGVGRSAGGLLMGAVANLRPDLFKAIIADVRFVDVVNTMMDTSLPLTTAEYNEWGNPDEKRCFQYMLSYSPYDNVNPQAYPHMLVVGGLNDPRVTYWEPAKWVARLRHTKTDSNLLLLKIHMGSGHAGASGRFEYLKEIALELAFALKVFEIT